jgi:hypothetical protein
MPAELVLERLTKIFRGRGKPVVAVDHVDLEVGKGRTPHPSWPFRLWKDHDAPHGGRF